MIVVLPSGASDISCPYNAGYWRRYWQRRRGLPRDNGVVLQAQPQRHVGVAQAVVDGVGL